MLGCKQFDLTENLYFSSHEHFYSITIKVPLGQPDPQGPISPYWSLVSWLAVYWPHAAWGTARQCGSVHWLAQTNIAIWCRLVQANLMWNQIQAFSANANALPSWVEQTMCVKDSPKSEPCAKKYNVQIWDLEGTVKKEERKVQSANTWWVGQQYNRS